MTPQASSAAAAQVSAELEAVRNGTRGIDLGVVSDLAGLDAVALATSSPGDARRLADSGLDLVAASMTNDSVEQVSITMAVACGLLHDHHRPCPLGPGSAALLQREVDWNGAYERVDLDAGGTALYAWTLASLGGDRQLVLRQTVLDSLPASDRLIVLTKTDPQRIDAALISAALAQSESSPGGSTVESAMLEAATSVSIGCDDGLARLARDRIASLTVNSQLLPLARAIHFLEAECGDRSQRPTVLALLEQRRASLSGGSPIAAEWDVRESECVLGINDAPTAARVATLLAGANQQGGYPQGDARVSLVGTFVFARLADLATNGCPK